MNPFTLEEIKHPKSYTETRLVEQQYSRATSGDKFPCPNCRAVYNRSDNLIQHQKFACNRKPRFACPYCKSVRKRTCETYAHVRTKHEGLLVSCIDLEDSNKVLTPRQY